MTVKGEVGAKKINGEKKELKTTKLTVRLCSDHECSTRTAGCTVFYKTLIWYGWTEHKEREIHSNVSVSSQ